MNLAFAGKGNSSLPEALEEQVNTTPQAKLSNENYAYISDIIEFDNECISDALYNRALSKYQKKSKLTIEEAEILYQNGDLKVEDIIDNDKKTINFLKFWLIYFNELNSFWVYLQAPLLLF